MMNTIGIGSGLGFSILWLLHIASVIAFFTGLIFLIVLAIRTFKPEQLKNWAIWLMIGGVVVCLFTIVMMGHPWDGMRYRSMGQWQQDQQFLQRGGMMR